MHPPDFLVIGHICHDRTTDGYLPGGAAAYAGLLAVRLGYRAAAMTSFGGDFQFAEMFEPLDLQVVTAPATTVFENIYENGRRIQFLHEKAADLLPEQLPAAWQQSKAVLLGPICDEVSFAFLSFFKNATVCACPQGWMRQWNAEKRVSPKSFPDWSLLAGADIISMSEADVAGDWDLIEKIAGVANILLVTQGERGATVFYENRREHFPAFPALEVDPTGAGDIFAAAFTLHFSSKRNVPQAVRFAHAAASLSVGAKGMNGIPGMAAVQERAGEVWDL